MASVDSSDVEKLLKSCEHLKGCFTAQELVRQVMYEGPSDALELSAAWLTLIEAERIQTCAHGSEIRYCLAETTAAETERLGLSDPERHSRGCASSHAPSSGNPAPYR